MSTCVYIQIRCKPGTTYKVAEDIALREIHSELYSTSGEYDLLMKLYIPKDADVGKYINENLLDIAGIERSLTTMTFKVVLSRPVDHHGPCAGRAGRRQDL